MGVSRILMAGLAVVLFVGVTVGCTPPPPPSGALLAVAYSNVDGIDGFDPSGGDVLIAKLLDSNADGAPSAGDTVVTNRYPLNADATQFAAFRTTTHPVADVVTTTNGSPSSAFIKVSVFSRDYPTVPAGEISWAHHPRWRPGGLTAYFEHYAEYRYAPEGATWFVDQHSSDLGLGNDAIQAELGSPSAPSAEVSSFWLRGQDEPFVDVDIFI